MNSYQPFGPQLFLLGDSDPDLTVGAIYMAALRALSRKGCKLSYTLRPKKWLNRVAFS